MGKTGDRPKHKASSPQALREWWRQCSPPEKELRALCFLLDRNPLIAPVHSVVDTTDSEVDAPPAWVAAHVSPDFYRPFRDPEALDLHPYVREQYLTSRAHDTPQTSPDLAPKPDVVQLRSFPPIVFHPDHFDAGGAFTWAYAGPRDVVQDSAHLVAGHLGDLRDPTLKGFASAYSVADLQLLKAIRVPRVVMTVLRALTKQKVELVPVYATLRHSGAAFLTALTYYRDLEGRQRTLRARIRREKQSVRSHLTYWKTRVRPDTFAGTRARGWRNPCLPGCHPLPQRSGSRRLPSPPGNLSRGNATRPPPFLDIPHWMDGETNQEGRMYRQRSL